MYSKKFELFEVPGIANKDGIGGKVDELAALNK